ncbi:hypothetical protein pipiens_019728 [Culex pipiens pipiens]|uniref:Uncharacterized protein n=1 Tax=Culex pipiens pipiens TaxID=38569 RepID=A0ABD1DTN5_CULPP
MPPGTVTRDDHGRRTVVTLQVPSEIVPKSKLVKKTVPALQVSSKRRNHVNEYDAGTDLSGRHQHDSAAEFEPEKAVLCATSLTWKNSVQLVVQKAAAHRDQPQPPRLATRMETRDRRTGITTITRAPLSAHRNDLQVAVSEEDQRRKMERKRVAAWKLQELDKCNLQGWPPSCSETSTRITTTTFADGGNGHAGVGGRGLNAESTERLNLRREENQRRKMEHKQSESPDGSGRPSSFLTESVAVTKTVAGKIWPNANIEILISSVSELLCEFHESPHPNVYLNQNDPNQHLSLAAESVPLKDSSIITGNNHRNNYHFNNWIMKTKPVGNQAVPGHQPCADAIVCESRRKFRIAAANVGRSKIVRLPRQSAEGGRVGDREPRGQMQPPRLANQQQRNLHRDHDGHWRDSSSAVASFMNPEIVVQRPIIQDEKRIEAITKNDEFDFN